MILLATITKVIPVFYLTAKRSRRKETETGTYSANLGSVQDFEGLQSRFGLSSMTYEWRVRDERREKKMENAVSWGD